MFKYFGFWFTLISGQGFRLKMVILHLRTGYCLSAEAIQVTVKLYSSASSSCKQLIRQGSVDDDLIKCWSDYRTVPTLLQDPLSYLTL